MKDALFNGSMSKREHYVRDLALLCASVQQDGQYGPWSSGELAAVAFLLDDQAMLSSLGEDEESVMSRWAYDLFGVTGGEKDCQNGWMRTRTWFLRTRAVAAGNDSTASPDDAGDD